ncbi:MAG: TetR/AcrR family transcriptional regulator [Streptomycetaceae bacterium]|jgi:AcrR family transcriptional regulator|nr:TetR/AcrR family transcriptional regulator [Streptomycetaceae bacterium]
MAEQTGRRGPYASGVARREEIVVAALELFAARTYDAVSLREVAAKVGITHSGLRHHFASKEELLTAVLHYNDQVSLTPDPEHEISGVEVHGVDWIRASVDVVAFNSRQPLVIRLFATLSVQATDPHHPAHTYFVKRYAVARGLVARELEFARANGDIRADTDVEAAAESLLATMDGLQIQWLLDPEHVDMVSAYRQFVDRFLTYLTSTDAAG